MMPQMSQVVKVAEHADLPELGHTGEEGELDVSVHCFQDSVERFEGIAESVLELRFGYCLKQRFVIFVHQNYSSQSSLQTCPFYDPGKSQ